MEEVYIIVFNLTKDRSSGLKFYIVVSKLYFIILLSKTKDANTIDKIISISMSNFKFKIFFETLVWYLVC